MNKKRESGSEKGAIGYENREKENNSCDASLHILSECIMDANPRENQTHKHAYTVQR